MEKQVIETLMSICNQTKQEISRKISVYFESNTAELHKGAVDILARDLQQVDKCIDQLNKLKKFELPTNYDIEQILHENGILPIPVDPKSLKFRFYSEYINGAFWMRDLIKQKLSL